MDVRIVVATHKEYPMPSDPVYLPMQAGRALNGPLPYAGDDTGLNISAKNPNYCELTCLYWAWKNLSADYIGLCHYRRYFARRNLGDKPSRVLSGADVAALLAETPVLLPKKRQYFIETTYSHYAHAHHAQDLDRTRDIIDERCPAYLDAFDAVMARTGGHRFNMLVMRRDLLDAYCAWLFDILFQLEERLDISDYDKNDRRVFGFVSERLLDVWLMVNPVEFRELPVVNMESQHWVRKGAAFLRRKFAGGSGRREAT